MSVHYIWRVTVHRKTVCSVQTKHFTKFFRQGKIYKNTWIFIIQREESSYFFTKKGGSSLYHDRVVLKPWIRFVQIYCSTQMLNGYRTLKNVCTVMRYSSLQYSVATTQKCTWSYDAISSNKNVTLMIMNIDGIIWSWTSLPKLYCILILLKGQSTREISFTAMSCSRWAVLFTFRISVFKLHSLLTMYAWELVRACF